MDGPLPLSSLRLLVPPLRLMSAVMWQVVGRRSLEHYGKLEDFVCLVTETVPELLTDRQRALLLLGLRAKQMSQEWIVEDVAPELIQTHLDRIQSICLTKSSDKAFEDAKARLMAYTQRSPGDQWAFGQYFNAELESLVCVFLSRLEELLPVPDFKQAASWLDSVPGGVDECLQSIPHSDRLRSVLQSQTCCREHLINRDSSPSQTNLLSSLPVCLSNLMVYHPSANSDRESEPFPEERMDEEREQQEKVCIKREDDEKSKVAELIGQDQESANRVAGEMETSNLGIMGFIVQSQSIMIIPQSGQHSLAVVSQSAPTLTLPVACRGQTAVNSPSGQSRPSPERNTVPVSSQKPQASPGSIIPESSDKPVECIRVENDTDSPTGESSSSETLPSSVSHNPRRVAHKCPTCGKCFIYRSQVLRHLTTHSRGGRYKCAQCGVGFPTPWSLNDHKRSVCVNATFDCAQCGKRFASLREQYRHRLTHKTNTCFQCGAGFRTQLELTRHHKTHWAQPLHQCCLCGKRFRLLSSLTNHKQTHSSGGGFACTQCERVFGSAKERDAHRQMHRVPKLVCPVCGETFTSQAKLIKHQQTHPVPEGSEGQRYKCRYCEETFTGLTLMRIHQRSHLVDRPHQCDQCEKNFTTLGSLQSHLRTHSEEKPFLCAHCGKRFRTKDGMEGHLRIHTGEKPFHCSYCGKRFTALAGLNVHVRRHTGERPYVCEVCGKAWPSGGDLQKHMRCHTGERPYSCVDCGKTFSISCHLTEHMKTHSGEKPFSCPECGKSLKRKFDLKKHLLTHSGVRPYPCPHCDKSYTRRTHLNRHLQKHSAELLAAAL